MTSSPELCDLVYHVPQGGAYACIEPVTHVVDAFNMHAQGITDTGFHSLQPQETLSGTITITLHTV
jgi:aldose 1-epimerase